MQPAVVQADERLRGYSFNERNYTLHLPL